MSSNKTKIAAVKFGGMATGGTERYLQTVVANLPKDQFEVDFFYCDAAPYVGSDWRHPDTDPKRLEYVKNGGVNLIKFNVQAKNVTTPTHDWLGTNFWEKFNEENYDIIQTARAGHPEFPFNHINKTPIVDIITLPGMAENKENIFKVIHISRFQASTWVKAGGAASKIEIIPLFSEIKKPSGADLRDELGINKECFVYGLHQRNDDGIFSPAPLQAYSEVESSSDEKNDVAFVLMGGGNKYLEQVKQLGLKNFYHIEHSGDEELIDKFLATLNVYTHGRADGETYSLAIAEAMYYGLPIISHVAPAMGHAETIGNAGIVCNNLEDYRKEMEKYKVDQEYLKLRAKNAKVRYDKELSLDANMPKIIKIYEKIMADKCLDNMPDEDFWNSF